MASNFVIKEESYDYHPKHDQAPLPLPPPPARGVARRSLSSNSSCCGQGVAGVAAPKCVCAPATHAGSFKCRLHRTNTQGHIPRPRSQRHGPQAPPPPSPTVEAQ